MSFNVDVFGNTSQYTELFDHSLAASQPASKTPPDSSVHILTPTEYNLEAEHAFGRPESFQPSMDIPLGTDEPSSSPMRADSPAPSRPSNQSLYQVNLPEWHTQYTTCVQHFLDHAQHAPAVQSLAAYLNIRLPCQHSTNPVKHFTNSSGAGQFLISPRHYIRRLIATGNDSPAILETFFGADWLAGIGSICKQERLNYLFTAKSAGWASTKAAYDVLPDEHVPFLRPLAGASEEEIRAAEDYWSDWLNMRDWMVGPRSPW